MGQFRRFAEDSGFVADAEQPDGETQVFDFEWNGYQLTKQVVHPWKSMKGKSWRDPFWGFPNRDDYPVVCVSYNDMKAFCHWLTEREGKAGRLPDGLRSQRSASPVTPSAQSIPPPQGARKVMQRPAAEGREAMARGS